MLPDDAARAEADFASVRVKAFFRQMLSLLTGRPNDLLVFEEVRAKLHIGGPLYRGLQTVPLAQIIGSVNRYHDFDRAFLPTQEHTADRWRRINRAWYSEAGLPPVLLYKIDQVYFVIDGHHRVSVARELKQEFIEAEVRECAVRVPVTSGLQAEDLQLLGDEVAFLERAGLDRLRPEARLTTTLLGGYDRLLEHIAVHRFFMGLDFQRDISDSEAVEHWYDTVYLPVVSVIRDSRLLEAFPGRSETDLYLWVMDHRHYLVARGEADLVEPGRTAEEFVSTYLSGEKPPTV